MAKAFPSICPVANERLRDEVRASASRSSDRLGQQVSAQAEGICGSDERTEVRGQGMFLYYERKK